VAGIVVLLVMLAGFFAQQRITTGAFDRLEADQVALDAQRVRIGLEARTALLANYGATNSIWDTSYDDVRKGDRARSRPTSRPGI
jgi:sensor domain CHASE-containing protein